MSFRSILVVLAVFAALSGSSARAATDTHLVAQGNGTLAYGSPAVTCTGPAAVSFVVQSNEALYTESWGAGSPGVEACAVGAMTFFALDTNAMPTVQQCVQPYGGIIIPGYILSQTGTTYTLQSTFRLCNGTNTVDKIVIVVRTANITFTHTYTEGSAVLVRATGTIARIA
jgi:hypothetical protein